MEYQSKEWHPAVEEYCEAIFELDEDDLQVIQARIAERLSISRPAVSEMITRLERDGLIHTEGGHIRLTQSGDKLAQSVVRRHRLAERFLTDILDMDWEVAHHEAGKWEHIISPEVEKAMNRVLGEPTTCPHGNPIPGSKYVQPSTRHLNEVSEGEDFQVSRIPEELEFTPGLLKFLEDSRLVPGAKGKFIAATKDGTCEVQIAGKKVDVGSFAAERILVID